MNCKECLSIVEEYVEDSLELQTSHKMAAHISACGNCRIIHEELKNEQKRYSRYLLRVKEKPGSWDAVLTEIRKESSVSVANGGTVVTGLYERFSAVFFRRPLFTAMAALVVMIGSGFGLWYRNYVQKNDPGFGVASSTELSSNQKNNDSTVPVSPSPKDVIANPRKNEPRKLKVDKVGTRKDRLTSYSVRPGNKGRQSPVSFDSSRDAFNRHVERCEMVLRSFRNAVSKTDEPRFDISYERRLAKELLNNSVKFRREVQSQGNLPIENLLVDLEVILGGIARLPKKATSSDAKLIKGRMQESGIIARLQIQSSIARTSD